MKKAPVDITRSEIPDIKLIETSYQCRMGDSKERKLGATEIPARQVMNPDVTETLNSVEASIVAPKELAFDVVLTVSRDNLDSVTEENNKTINQKPHFNIEKYIPSPVGESCRIGDGELGEEAGTLKSLTSHLINPVATGTMDSVETSAFEPKRLVFSLAVSLDNNLDSVVEKQDESKDDSQGFVSENKPWYPNSISSGMRNGEEKIEDVNELAKMLSPQITAQKLTCIPNSMLNDAVKLKIPSFNDSVDRPGTLSANFPSPKRLGLSGPRETEAALHAHNSLVPDGVRGDDERNEEISGLVNCTAPHIVNTELNGSSHCINNDEVQDTCSPHVEGFQQMIKPVGENSDMREVEDTFYARDSFSPICDVTGCNNEATEVNGPAFFSKLGSELDQSLRKKEMEQKRLLLPELIGEEVLDLSDKRKHSLTSCFYEFSRQNSSLSGASFVSCRSHQTTAFNIIGHLVEAPKSVSTNLKSFGTNPKTEGEGSLVKNGEGIKHLSSGGRYFLRNSARQEKSNASNLQESSGQVIHVDANSWPKRRKMEDFSDFATATSPRPRKRPVHSKV
jgi:hypothetical protein